jgi:methyltransferase
MTVFYAVLALVLLQRLAELLLAAANTRRLRARGAIEVDARFYPLFVLLHAAWLGSLALTVPGEATPSWPLLGVFLLLQIGRVWVIASLGPRWTTRIIVLPEAPLVRSGPYRFCRHPNYLIVAAEIAVLPLAFGAIANAAVFSVVNLLLIARRIRIEDRALASGAIDPCHAAITFPKTSHAANELGVKQ